MVPALSDGVIVLNGYTDSDIAAHLAGEDEGIARHFGPWPQASTEATVRDAFTRWSHDWKTGGPTRAFAARETATGRLLGGCELRLQPDGSAHVSYWTSGGERRRGYATRALALLLQYALSIGVTRLESHVAEDNLASRRVSEKAGFRPASKFTANRTGIIRYKARLQTSRARQGSSEAPPKDQVGPGGNGRPTWTSNDMARQRTGGREQLAARRPGRAAAPRKP